jgi:two-component system NtrC family response regulator
MPENGGSIVLIEDDASQRRVMQHHLEQAGYTLHLADNAHDGLMQVRSINPRLVITDICLGESSGLDLLSDIKSYRKNTMVLVVTAYGSLEKAVEAIRLGAFDYLPKPFSREQLLLAVYKALAFDGLQQENKKLKAALISKGHRTLLGDSHEMQIVHDLIKRMAGSCASVLILGESGTGKELAARLLHDQSDCGKGPFVPVNCAAIPAMLLESELFGHVKGSFTGAVNDYKGKFEQAEGGTLFLDEIVELPLDLQPKLLRALQEQEITPVGGTTKAVNTRIIAATNSNLEELIQQGRFRSDLYYRLAVLPLTLPTLRARTEDVALLAQHFLNKYAEGRKLQLSAAAMEIIQNYSWPGNVRELENLMQRLAVLARRELIDKEDLPMYVQACNKIHEPLVVHMPRGGFPLRDIERQAIVQALVASGGNRTKAADFLHIPRHILAYRIKKFGIDNSSAPAKLTTSSH